MVCSTYLERFPSSSALSTTAPFCRRFFARKPLFLTDIAHHTRKLGMRPLFVAHDPYVDWRFLSMLRSFSSPRGWRCCTSFRIIQWIILIFKEMKKYPGPGLHWKFCFSCKFCFSWRQDIHALYASASAERAHYSTLSVYKVRGMRNISKNNL